MIPKIRIWVCDNCRRLMAFDIVANENGKTTANTQDDINLFTDDANCHNDGWQIYNNFITKGKWIKEE